MAETERIQKKAGRYYKAPRTAHPVNALMPAVFEVVKRLFPTGEDGPSVTTVLGLLAKPALIAWAAREERKMVATIAANLYHRLPELVEGTATKQKFFDLLVEEAGKPANRRLLEKAASVGTEVHNRIEWMFKGELNLDRAVEAPPLTSPQAERSFKRWEEWRVQVKLKVLTIEQRLYSTVFGFGGTLDLLAEVTLALSVLTEAGYTLANLGVDPFKPLPETITVKVVIDFKTGKAIYAESYLQNIAYRMALQELGTGTKGGIIVRLPKSEEDPEFDAKIVPNDPDLAPTFLALLVAHKWYAKEHNTKRSYTKKSPQVGASIPAEKVVV